MPGICIGITSFVNWTWYKGPEYKANGKHYLKEIPLNRGIFIFQTLYRNIIVLAHNIVIVFIVLIIFKYNIINEIPLFILGFILLCWNLMWIMTLLAVICARYRDLPQIVASFLQVIFYITPILFKKEMLNKYPLLIEVSLYIWRI